MKCTGLKYSENEDMLVSCTNRPTWLVTWKSRMTEETVTQPWCNKCVRGVSRRAIIKKVPIR